MAFDPTPSPTEQKSAAARLDFRVSAHFWDGLIEKFNHHALNGSQHFVSPGGLKDSEAVLRCMAREPRWKRSELSRIFIEMLKTTPGNYTRVVGLTPARIGDPYYVFALIPKPDLEGFSYEQYREARRGLLEAYCKVARLENPGVQDILGIATEPGLSRTSRSEDSLLLDGRNWTPQMIEQAAALKGKLRISENRKRTPIVFHEYPQVGDDKPKLKNFRNKPCPCGSGKKYKHCCLK